MTNGLCVQFTVVCKLSCSPSQQCPDQRCPVSKLVPRKRARRAISCIETDLYRAPKCLRTASMLCRYPSEPSFKYEWGSVQLSSRPNVRVGAVERDVRLQSPRYHASAWLGGLRSWEDHFGPSTAKSQLISFGSALLIRSPEAVDAYACLQDSKLNCSSRILISRCRSHAFVFTVFEFPSDSKPSPHSSQPRRPCSSHGSP